MPEDGRERPRPDGVATGGEADLRCGTSSRPTRRAFHALTPMAPAGLMPRRRRSFSGASPSRGPTGSQVHGALGPIRRRFAGRGRLNLRRHAIVALLGRPDPIDPARSGCRAHVLRRLRAPWRCLLITVWLQVRVLPGPPSPQSPGLGSRGGNGSPRPEHLSSKEPERAAGSQTACRMIAGRK